MTTADFRARLLPVIAAPMSSGERAALVAEFEQLLVLYSHRPLLAASLSRALLALTSPGGPS